MKEEKFPDEQGRLGRKDRRLSQEFLGDFEVWTSKRPERFLSTKISSWHPMALLSANEKLVSFMTVFSALDYSPPPK